jgi:predicted ArsR family transcriptional regulator
VSTPIIDTLDGSRRDVLVALKRARTATIAQLAEQVGVTTEAVRQSLMALQAEGWVKRVRLESSGAGRPPSGYALTEAGEQVFPKRYDDLVVLMIDAAGSELGPEAVKRLLAAVAQSKVDAWTPALAGLDLPAKVEALRDLYAEADPWVEVSEVEDGFRLTELNCPFLSVAMRRPALCSVTVNALTRLLGVRVEREERFQAGDRRCVFRVRTNQPVRLAGFEAEPEPEPEPAASQR